MDVIIKESTIHGKGVFAVRDFKKGEIVTKWDTSKTLTKEEVDKLPEEEKDYVSFLDGKYTVMQPPEKYVNHSCEPNTEAKNHCDVAIRDIKKGEEITGDYTEDLVPGSEMKCVCGSKNCKDLIKNNS